MKTKNKVLPAMTKLRDRNSRGASIRSRRNMTNTQPRQTMGLEYTSLRTNPEHKTYRNKESDREGKITEKPEVKIVNDILEHSAEHRSLRIIVRSASAIATHKVTSIPNNQQ